MNIAQNMIGTNFKIIREEIGFTQCMVANFLCCDQSLISKFESGERSIQVDFLERLATLYGCDLDEINYGIEQRKINTTFRATNFDCNDLNAICDINSIALNNEFMTKLANGKLYD